MPINQHQTPCPKCPWTRKVKPGALGGSPPETFIGQAAGKFWLPCHMRCDFSDPDWKVKINETAQCAGAAIYRSNIGKPGQGFLLSLPEDKSNVFATPAEFLAHHSKIPLPVAEYLLTVHPPELLLAMQAAQTSNKYHLVPKS